MSSNTLPRRINTLGATFNETLKVSKTSNKTRETLANNLNYLIKINGDSGESVAKRCGISAKTVNNARKTEHSVTLDVIDKIASAFGLNGWHLIMPNLPDDLKSSKQIEQLYSNYTAASADGRDMIEKIAEREADYANKDINKAS